MAEFLVRVVRKNNTENVTSEKSPKGSKSRSNSITGKSIPGGGESKYKGPEVENLFYLRNR